MGTTVLFGHEALRVLDELVSLHRWRAAHTLVCSAADEARETVRVIASHTHTVMAHSLTNPPLFPLSGV